MTWRSASIRCNAVISKKLATNPSTAGLPRQLLIVSSNQRHSPAFERNRQRPFRVSFGVSATPRSRQLVSFTSSGCKKSESALPTSSSGSKPRAWVAPALACRTIPSVERMVKSSRAQPSNVESCSGVAGVLCSRKALCDIGPLLAKTFSYPQGPRWIQTPPPYDRVLERPYGLWIIERLHHSRLRTESEAIGYLLLRKYDCTRVQVVTPQAHTLEPATAFRPTASVLTSPIDSAQFLVCPILETPLDARRPCANT